ncbi:MAG: hypothetical protein JXC85_00210 [Candidatus Aenigmarchaeota archaeon]|nr:hypothetical protein [Candidatus Aenigmarchaeota archaeon]
MESSDLVRLGLTEGEASVYLALLESGPSTVGPIVKRAGVAYSNVYEILDRLTKKGLVSFIIKSKTRHFQAAEPTGLHEYIDRKEKEIRDEKRIVERLIPELSRLSKMRGEKLLAEVFTGMKGLRTVYEKVLEGYEPGDDYVFFYDPTERREIVDRFFLDFEKRIYRPRRIIMRGVVSKDFFFTSDYMKRSEMVRKGLWDVRYVDFPFPGNIDIFKDRLLIVSWSGPIIAILIHSSDISAKFLNYFESVWKIAKK